LLAVDAARAAVPEEVHLGAVLAGDGDRVLHGDLGDTVAVEVEAAVVRAVAVVQRALLVGLVHRGRDRAVLVHVGLAGRAHAALARLAGRAGLVGGVHDGRGGAVLLARDDAVAAAGAGLGLAARAALVRAEEVDVQHAAVPQVGGLAEGRDGVAAHGGAHGARGVLLAHEAEDGVGARREERLDAVDVVEDAARVARL